MNKFFLVASVALVASGCAVSPRYNPGPGGWAFRTSLGVFLQITHTCTDTGRLYQSGYGMVMEVVGATPHGVQLIPVGFDGEAIFTFRSRNWKEEIVATYSASFRTDRYSGQAQTWTISSRSIGVGERSRCLI